jgi:hypothetical protein
MPWPKRPYICVDCRTLLPDASCPAGGRHRVTSLGSTESREPLLDEVWGSKSVRERLLIAGQVGGGTAAASTGLHACDVWGALELDWFILVFLAVALAWFLGSVLVSALRRLLHRRRVRRSARAASASGLQFGRGRGVLGTVKATRSEPDPLTNRPSVAYAAQLSDTRGVMLRDCRTIGFDVELETGETVRIPEGLIAIDAAHAPEVAVDPDIYRFHVDRDHDPSSDFPLFPGDAIRLHVIQPGDTVELAGETEPVVQTEAGGYRDAPSFVLVLRGLVRLRPC